MFILPYWYGFNDNITAVCNEDQLRTILSNTLAVQLEPPENNITDKVYICIFSNQIILSHRLLPT